MGDGELRSINFRVEIPSSKLPSHICRSGCPSSKLHQAHFLSDIILEIAIGHHPAPK